MRVSQGLVCLSIVAAVLPAPGAAQADRIVLARGGQPTATIVVPSGATEREQQAANDLQHYVQRICGVVLPVHDDGHRVSGTGLYIGQCEPTLPTDIPDARLNPETYAIRVRDGSVFFTGRYPTPTYFAVAAFMEQSLGVRWFAPGELWEYVPAGRPGDLSVEVRDVVSVPDTSPRVWSGHAWNEDWQRWCLRNRAVQSEVVPRRQFQNFLHRVFPVEKYGESHPEYYPLIEGKRWIPPPGNISWRPCESNPEVIRLTVEYAREWFDAHPDVDSFSLGMDDISHLCSCDRCRAWDPRPDSYEKREFSDRHYKFVNAVAREVAKTHPDRYMGTLIYSIARKLPETVEKLEPNVFGYITETSALWWQPEVKRADQALTREWAKRCQHLSRYDYYGFACISPRFYPHLMAEQVKYDKSLGLEGMYTEVYTFLPQTAPMIWAFARLQWDASLDVDALLGEFYRRMYGRAARTMESYYDLMERAYMSPRPDHGGWEHRRLKAMAAAISPEALQEGMGLLQRARREADSDAARRRIEIVRDSLRYGGYAIQTYALSNQLERSKIHDQGSAKDALRKLLELARVARERDRYWSAALRRDDLLGETLRGLTDVGYMSTGQAPQLEAGGAAAALRLVAWYAAKRPESQDEVLARLQSEGRGASFLEGVTGWLWVQREQPPDLAVNGDFEQTSSSAGAAEMDWVTADTPAGWSRWTSQDGTRFETLAGRGRNGSTAVAISGGASAVYIQNLPVRPGERYLVACWTCDEPSGADARASLAVRFRTSAGAWHPRRDLERQVERPAGDRGWQPLILQLTVPDGAATMTVMPGVQGQASGVRALFDDVSVYRLP